MFKNLPWGHLVSFYTNLVFGFVGIIMVFNNGLLYIPLMLALIYLTVGSGYYHYYGRSEFVWMDWSSMYFVFCIQIATFVSMLFMNLFYTVPIMIIAIILASILSKHFREINNMKYKWMRLSYVALGVLYTLSMILSFVVNQDFWAPFAGAMFFLLALIIRQYGQKLKPKSPITNDWLHGLWHFYAGVGLLFMNAF